MTFRSYEQKASVPLEMYALTEKTHAFLALFFTELSQNQKGIFFSFIKA